MKEKRINEIKAVIFIATAVIIFASLISFTPLDLKFYTSHPNIPAHNFIRTFGAYLGGLLLFLFGWSCYALPLFIFYLGIRLFKQEKPDIRLARIVGLLIFLLSLSSLTGVFITKSQPIEFSRAGFLGYLISNTTISYFGKLGAAVIFIALALLSLVLVTDILISSFFLGINNKIKLFFALLFKNLSRKKIKTLKIKPLVSEKKQSLVSEVKPRIVLSKQETIEKEIPKKLPLEPKPKIQIKTPLTV
jgi:DNA segregation ATPase FtsK/SpoIIIE-like protein